MLNQKVNSLSSASILTDTNAEKSLTLSSSMLNASIWVTDVQGQVLMQAGQLSAPGKIPNFNTDFASLSYLSGRFFNTLDRDVITVFSPVSSDV